MLGSVPDEVRQGEVVNRVAEEEELFDVVYGYVEVRGIVGEFFDRDDLPQRFRRTPFSLEEIDAIETGGASLRA